MATKKTGDESLEDIRSQVLLDSKEWEKIAKDEKRFYAIGFDVVLDASY